MLVLVEVVELYVILLLTPFYFSEHPNVKLFITQAGLQSTDEAITAGVPVLGIPMLGDQWYNAEKYVKHGIGEKLLIETFNTEIFKSTVEKIIKDKRYNIYLHYINSGSPFKKEFLNSKTFL